jgi:hypothetical protein
MSKEEIMLLEKQQQQQQQLHEARELISALASEIEWLAPKRERAASTCILLIAAADYLERTKP